MESMKTRNTKTAVPARVTVIPPSQRTPDPVPTPGMLREQVAASDKFWVGHVRTEPSTVSGWHHHGDYDTTIYVITGAIRLESGAGGHDIVEGRPGDFVFVPKGTVHRESNPGSEHAELVVFRAGMGAPTVNIEGPATGS